MKNKVVLLVNLGTPDSPSLKDVRKYLKEFLMDERIIDIIHFYVPASLRVLLCRFAAIDHQRYIQEYGIKNMALR